MTKLKLIAFTLILANLGIAEQPRPKACEFVLDSCNTLLEAQDNEIAGLKDALRESRGQTKHAVDRLKESNSSGPTLAESILIGAGSLLLGVIVGRKLLQ